MRNKYFALALLVVLSFTLTACTLQDLPVVGKYLGGGGDSGGGTAQTGTITVWGLWENPDVINDLIAAYQIANPGVTVNYEDRSVINPNDYKDRIATRGGTDLEADVVLVHNSWVPKLQQGLSSMPSSIMSVDQYSQKFYPTAVKSAVINNNIYAVPSYYDGLVLVYNKDHFAEVGQTTPPTSWTEFIELATSLTKREGTSDIIVRGGAAMGTADNITHFSDILGLLFNQTKIKLPDDIDSAASRDAVQFYTDFTSKYKVWDSTMPEANIAFSQGKVSMMFVPSWRIIDLLESNPDLNFGVAQVPQALPNDKATFGSYWMWAVPSASTNKDLAWGFISFITSPEQELLRYDSASKIRSFGAPYANVELASMVSSDPYVGPVLSDAPFAGITPEIAARSGDDAGVTALNKAINKIVSKDMTVQEALAALKSGTL